MTEHDSSALKMSGAYLLRNIAELHASLQLALSRRQQSLVLDLAGVDDIDVSFIQLMLSAAKTAAENAGSIALINMPDAIAACFKGAGVDLAPFAPRAPQL